MPPIRQGRAKNLTLEVEACTILERLAPNMKAQGYLISVLLRQEEQRRLDARAQRHTLAPPEGELVRD